MEPLNTATMAHTVLVTVFDLSFLYIDVRTTHTTSQIVYTTAHWLVGAGTWLDGPDPVDDLVDAFMGHAT